MANSRVGLRITALTPVSMGCFNNDSSRGSTKASVLPVPVCAVATTSRPSSAGGIDSDCTGVGVTKLFWARLACKTADTLNSEKVFIQYFRGKEPASLTKTTRNRGRVADLLSIRIKYSTAAVMNRLYATKPASKRYLR